MLLPRPCGPTSKMAIGPLLLGCLLFLTGCLRPAIISTTHPVQAADASSASEQSGNPQNDSSLQMLSLNPTPTALTAEGGMIIVPPPENARTPVGESPQNEDVLPDHFRLDSVPVGKQTRPLNCEFQTASDLVWSYGFPFSWDEIFAVVGPDPNGNPHVGFVGESLDDPPGSIYPDGYGVYAEPIAKGLQSLGIHAEVFYGKTADWLREQIASGSPVMVWATANMIQRDPEYWTTKDGQRVKGVRGEHTYLVYGYDREGVWVGDPWDGQRKHYPWDVFLASWDILDRMALMIMTTSDAQSP